MKKLYLLTNPYAASTCTYATALVCAYDEEEARELQPEPEDNLDEDWPGKEEIIVTCIGTASNYVECGIISVSMHTL